MICAPWRFKKEADKHGRRLNLSQFETLLTESELTGHPMFFFQPTILTAGHKDFFGPKKWSANDKAIS